MFLTTELPDQRIGENYLILQGFVSEASIQFNLGMGEKREHEPAVRIVGGVAKQQLRHKFHNAVYFADQFVIPYTRRNSISTTQILCL